jgi:hypothetical protein
MQKNILLPQVELTMESVEVIGWPPATKAPRGRFRMHTTDEEIFRNSLVDSLPLRAMPPPSSSRVPRT